MSRPSRACYSVLGIPIEVSATSARALARVDETYAAFRQPELAPAAFSARLECDTNGFRVTDSRGHNQRYDTEQGATIGLLDRMVHGILAELHARSIYAIHAGACVYRGAGLLIAGRSGQGKTTLVLGLLRRGFGLLSDEFGVVMPGAQQLAPYRRSIHIRPGTPEIIPELGFMADQPQVQLGGGIEWTLTPDCLEQVFPGCLAEPAPLRSVLLLDGVPEPGATPTITPIPAALAAIELVRGTWAASQDFGAALARIGSLLGNVRCARLRVGALDATTACVAKWMEAEARND